MRQIRATELKAWLDDPDQPAPLLLDVREPREFDHCSIAGSLSMPMGTVPARCGELDPAAPVVVICHHGMRSYQVAQFLERQGFSVVANLTGGVAAWAGEVDRGMPTY